MEILPAHIKDLKSILNVQKIAFKQEAKRYQNDNIQPIRQTYEEILLECASKVVLKAVEKGDIIGAVRAEQSAKICHIKKLVVLPEYQGKGIGRRLLTEIENYFPNAVKFALETGAQSDNNILLYKKVGYNVVGRGIFNDGVEAVYLEKDNKQQEKLT